MWQLVRFAEEKGPEFAKQARRCVASFSDFSENNDPYQERDFDAFEIQGSKLFFKIDYCATELTLLARCAQSKNPMEFVVTTFSTYYQKGIRLVRGLTIGQKIRGRNLEFGVTTIYQILAEISCVNFLDFFDQVCE